MKKGFTLVELSIVLVIIGLLIGGILAAQSMIGTAKIQGLVRQVGQFDAAVENFQTKYQQLPGDTNLMGNAPGNNDGAIRYSSFPVSSWQGEAAKYWADLSNSGLTSSNGVGYLDESIPTSIIDTDINKKLPRASAGTNAYFLVLGPPNKNYYFIGQPYSNGTSLGSDISMKTSFTPTDALAVDQKMDDGQPNSGNVLGEDWIQTTYNLPDEDPISHTNNCANVALTAYRTDLTTIGCFLLIRLGTSTGNLK